MPVAEKQLRFLRPSQEFELIDHFHNFATYGTGISANVPNSPFNWVVTTSGAGAGIAPAGTVSATGASTINPGVLSLQSGTAPASGTASRSCLSTPAVITLGSAVIELEYAVRMTPGVSGQDHEEFLGFGDSVTQNPQTIGAYIYYDWSSFSAQWQYIVRSVSSGNATAIASGVAPGNQVFQKIKIRFSKSPVRATFSINDANIITPDVIFADGSNTGLEFLYRKYEGTTNQFLDLDYVRFSYNSA